MAGISAIFRLEPAPPTNPDGSAAAKLYNELLRLPPNKLPELILNTQDSPEAWSLPNCVIALDGICESTVAYPGLLQSVALWINGRAQTLINKAYKSLRAGSKPSSRVKLTSKNRKTNRPGISELDHPTPKEHEWFATLAETAAYLQVSARVRPAGFAEKAAAQLCAAAQDLLSAWLESGALVTAEELGGICLGLGKLVKSCSVKEMKPIQINPGSLRLVMVSLADRCYQASCTLTVVANFMSGLRLLAKYSPPVRKSLVASNFAATWLERMTSCVCRWKSSQDFRMQSDAPDLQMHLFVIMRTVAELGGCWKCVEFIRGVFLPGAHLQDVSSPVDFLSMVITCKAILHSEDVAEAVAPLPSRSSEIDVLAWSKSTLPALEKDVLKTHQAVTDSVWKLLTKLVIQVRPILQDFAPCELVELLNMLGGMVNLSQPFLVAALRVAAQQLTEQKNREVGVLSLLEQESSESAAHGKIHGSKVAAQHTWSAHQVASLLSAAARFGQQTCDNGRWLLWNASAPAEFNLAIENDVISSSMEIMSQDAMQGVPLLSHAWEFPENSLLTQTFCDVLRAVRGVITPRQINQMSLPQLSLLVGALHQLQSCNEAVHGVATELIQWSGNRALTLLGFPQHGGGRVDACGHELPLGKYAQLLWDLVHSGIAPQSSCVFRMLGTRILSEFSANLALVQPWCQTRRLKVVELFNSATQLLSVLAQAIEVYPQEAQTLPKECVDAVLETAKLGLKLIPGSAASQLEADAMARLLLAAATLSTSPNACKLRTSAATKALNNLFQTVIITTCWPGDPTDLYTLRPAVCSPDILADLLYACGRQGLHHTVGSRLAESALSVCEESFHTWVTSWRRGKYWLGRLLWGLVAVSAHSSRAPEVLKRLVGPAVSTVVTAVFQMASLTATAATDLLALTWVFAVLDVQSDEAIRALVSHLNKVTQKGTGQHSQISVRGCTWHLSLAWEVMTLSCSQDCEELGSWPRTAKQAWDMQRTASRFSSALRGRLEGALRHLGLPFQIDAEKEGFGVDALLDVTSDELGSWCIAVVFDADLPPDPAGAVLAPSPQSHNYGREQAKWLHLHRKGFHVIQIWESQLRQGAEPAARAIQLVIKTFKEAQVKAEQTHADDASRAPPSDCGGWTVADSASAAESQSGWAEEDGSRAAAASDERARLPGDLSRAASASDAGSRLPGTPPHPMGADERLSIGTKKHELLHSAQFGSNQSQVPDVKKDEEMLHSDQFSDDHGLHQEVTQKPAAETRRADDEATIFTDQACLGDGDCFSGLSDDELFFAFAEIMMPEPGDCASNSSEKAGGKRGVASQGEELYWVSIGMALPSGAAAECLTLGGVKAALGIDDKSITFCCEESPDFGSSLNFLGFQLETDMKRALSARSLEYLKLEQVDRESQQKKRQRVHSDYVG